MVNEMASKKTDTQEVERTHSAPTFLPPVDIYEKESILVVVADMPGVDEKTVDVNFEKGILTVRGRVEEKIRENFKPIYSEYKVGNYERSFSVPEAIDIERIEASVKNGVLKITLPRSRRPDTKKIPVNIA